MRHRRRGRKLGRNPSHRRAMLRNLASSLFLTERDAETDDNAPKVKGRVVTTLHKAKEVRPLVERCITIARRSLEYADKAQEFATEANRGTAEWKQWRDSDTWQKWCAARAPVVAARRRALQLLGDKEAVQVLFDEVAPRFSTRDGGYTRVLKIAARRLGDSGEQAILEFVGVRDRITVRSQKPAFSSEDSDADSSTTDEVAAEATDADEVADTVDSAAGEKAAGEKAGD